MESRSGRPHRPRRADTTGGREEHQGDGLTEGEAGAAARDLCHAEDRDASECGYVARLLH